MNFHNLLTIIIPCYNQDIVYLDKSLKSIKTAFPTMSPEIIVCDDGSSDLLSNAMEKLCVRYNAVFFKNTKNLGMNVSRNLAALRSSGEYLLLLDSDDALVENIEKEITQKLQLSPTILFGDHMQYDKNLEKVLQTREKHKYFSIFKEYSDTKYNPFFFSTFLFHPQFYKKTAFLNVGGFDCSYECGDEIDLQLKLLYRCEASQIAYTPRQLYRYRKNPNSVVHDRLHYQKLINNIEKIIAKHYFYFFDENVTVQWIGREKEFNAAHYLIINKITKLKVTPPWFDYEKMQLIV